MVVEIISEGMRLRATLHKNPTAGQIAAILPIKGRANRWGDEIYFEIPLQIDLASDAVAEVEVGTLAYWPTGSAVCLFFGPTPVSRGDKPQAYSPVNVFGQIDGDASILRNVPDGAAVVIHALNTP